MCGRHGPQAAGMLALRPDPESLIPPDHPLRTSRAIAERVLAELSPLFDEMYAEVGRHSMPPERLLSRATGV